MAEEDIQILLDQTNINRELAKELIIHKNGDIVECILEMEKHENLDSVRKMLDLEKQNRKNKKSDEIEKEVDVSNKQNLEEYRDIVDSKDTIYNYKAQQKEERKKKNKLIQEKLEKGESVEDLEEKKMCNETIYYSFRKGKINLLPLQVGDIYETKSNINNLKKIIRLKKFTSIKKGIKLFIDWYKNYHNIQENEK